MEAIKKQATRLRKQVAKQQQVILKHLRHFGNEDVIIDEAEFQCYQQLQALYNSTRAAKHYQRNIVRDIEGFVSTSSKQMAIGECDYALPLFLSFKRMIQEIYLNCFSKKVG
uniref:Uncharacterized protein MANES_17G005400 n=1 Tax=Rhizophora mucronata TaxID=61149 RepID=A0A2P2L265_RHIMU